MENQEILAILESQPDEEWTQGLLTDHEGHYCALGWVGKTLDLLGATIDGIGPYRRIYDTVGDYELCDRITRINDNSLSHQDALDRLRELLS